MSLHYEIISRAEVTPSNPTPQNLRTYKLSMLDQVVPSILSPLLLYYRSTAPSKQIDGPDSFISRSTQELKTSLSEVLTRFYPFAGRPNADGLSIDCNDGGVPFTVVKFRGQNLSYFLSDPVRRRRLLPCDMRKDGAGSSVAMIQINHFDCGGAAVGAIFWHRAVDAPTVAEFLNSWAAVAKGSDQLPVSPNYILPSLFPQAVDQTEIEIAYSQLGAAILKRGKSVLRRYAFDAAAIAELKSRSGLERPTRVEVVSALLWKCFIAASLANGNMFSAVTHAVNLRRRAQPPFPSESLGNFQDFAVAACINDGANDLGELVSKIRDSLGKIDGDYVNKMRYGGGGVSVYSENRGRMWSGIPQGADYLYISSWCNLGIINGVDFGWGKPIRMDAYSEGSDTGGIFANGVNLMDMRDGEGIEAEMIVEERYVSAFENGDRLLPQASIVEHQSISASKHFISSQL